MKKLAITGGFIFLLGVVIFFATVAANGWDFTRLSSRPPLEEKNYDLNGSNQSIYLEDSEVPITVALSRDNQVHLTYFENDKEYYDIEENGSTVSIKKETKYQWINYVFNFDLQPRSFTILIPADFKGSLELETSNSSIKLDAVSLQDLILKNSNGSMKLENVSVQGNVNVSTSNSSIQINKGEIKGNLSCDNENGSIKLTEFSAKSIEANTSNASILADSTTALDSMVLENSNGKIELDEIRSNGDIRLDTKNAAIKGSIEGNMNDFSITSKTENASNNLPERSMGGTKNLEVSNENGSINIDFSHVSRADND